MPATRGAHADAGDHPLGDRQVEEHVESRDQIDTGRDHRRRMDERRHGRRAFHRVRQPGVQRELRALGECSDRKEHAHQRDQRATGGKRLRAREDVRQAQRVRVEHDQERGDHQSNVADDLGDEGFTAAGTALGRS